MLVQEFQERKKLEKILFSVPSVVVVLILVGVAMWGVGRAFFRERALNGDIASIKAKIAQARRESGIFETKLKDLQTEDGLEKEARGQFNLKKSGEEVVLFVDNGAGAAGDKPASGLASIWQAMRQWLKF